MRRLTIGHDRPCRRGNTRLLVVGHGSGRQEETAISGVMAARRNQGHDRAAAGQARPAGASTPRTPGPARFARSGANSSPSARSGARATRRIHAAHDPRRRSRSASASLAAGTYLAVCRPSRRETGRRSSSSTRRPAGGRHPLQRGVRESITSWPGSTSRKQTLDKDGRPVRHGDRADRRAAGASTAMKWGANAVLRSRSPSRSRRVGSAEESSCRLLFHRGRVPGIAARPRWTSLLVRSSVMSFAARRSHETARVAR